MENTMTSRLSGKTALITGASAGIGWASALALAGEGANLVLTARRQERLTELEAAVQKVGSKAVSLVGDAKEEETASQAVELAIKTFGSLDILINNVGIGNYQNLVDTSVEDYDEMMDSNMR
jgi:3-oxoacyl-[acyl-carrier protein] reductase